MREALILFEVIMKGHMSIVRDVHRQTTFAPSVNGGIHDSTEYGKLSISAHRPRIDECNLRNESAYEGSCRLGRRVLRATATKRFCCGWMRTSSSLAYVLRIQPYAVIRREVHLHAKAGCSNVASISKVPRGASPPTRALRYSRPLGR